MCPAIWHACVVHSQFSRTTRLRVNYTGVPERLDPSAIRLQPGRSAGFCPVRNKLWRHIQPLGRNCAITLCITLTAELLGCERSVKAAPKPGRACTVHLQRGRTTSYAAAYAVCLQPSSSELGANCTRVLQLQIHGKKIFFSQNRVVVLKR